MNPETTCCLDCYQWIGRKRDVCRGYDANGKPVLNDKSRVQWLVHWGVDEETARAHVAANPTRPGPVATEKDGETIVVPKPAHDAQDDKSCSGCSAGSRRRVPRRRPHTPVRRRQPPLPYGPGTELKKLWSKVPSCQRCNDLAVKMNRWGPDGCRKRLDEIVQDILPRAKKWLSENKPWVHAILGQLPIVEDSIIASRIRRDVLKAIELAEKNGPPSPKNRPPVTPIPFDGEPVRNLIYHVYPYRQNDIWKWNLDQLGRRLDLFNGKRLFAIAYDQNSVNVERAIERVAPLATEQPLVFRNDPATWELVSFLPLLQLVESLDANEVTFRAHAKGVTRIAQQKYKHVREWTEALYRVNLDRWDDVQRQLEQKAMTGIMRRRRSLGSAKWFYCGAFYWFRNVHVFRRYWRNVDPVKYGPEAWPSRVFDWGETDCLAADNCAQPYNRREWEKRIKPKLV